jgi:molecular chaperone GrpE
VETEATTPVERSESDAPQAEAPLEAGRDLAAELQAAKALADERYSELQYARAEIENVRKRALRIADERMSHSRRQTFGKFLSVLDNLERALKYDDSQDLRGGLQATLRGFEQILASEQILRIDTLGKPFDPRVAEAIATRESSDAEDDVVLEEAQRGYRLGEDLLRPALVVVAKRTSDGGNAPPA